MMARRDRARGQEEAIGSRIVCLLRPNSTARAVVVIRPPSAGHLASRLIQGHQSAGHQQAVMERGNSHVDAVEQRESTCPQKFTEVRNIGDLGLPAGSSSCRVIGVDNSISARHEDCIAYHRRGSDGSFRFRRKTVKGAAYPAGARPPLNAGLRIHCVYRAIRASDVDRAICHNRIGNPAIVEGQPPSNRQRGGVRGGQVFLGIARPEKIVSVKRPIAGERRRGFQIRSQRRSDQHEKHGTDRTVVLSLSLH